MNSEFKTGDVIVYTDTPTVGFVLLGKQWLYDNSPGLLVTWFDDGTSGLFSIEDLEKFIVKKELMKVSDIEALRIKLKYSDNLNG